MGTRHKRHRAQNHGFCVGLKNLVISSSPHFQLQMLVFEAFSQPPLLCLVDREPLPLKAEQISSDLSH